ncbi:MAG: pseudouridine synthase, partial [Planctomycetota bacterium]
MTETDKVRIQKYLSEVGVASRRAIEQMVLDGRITLNSKLVTDLPCFVDPAKDRICVDGRLVGKRLPKKVYYLLNKPKGVVCTQSDPQGRTRAIDLIPPIRQRVYCVGRLDTDSTGLIILTNDGTITHQLTHPSYGVPKTYVVEVDGKLTPQTLEKLKGGMWLDGTSTVGGRVKVLRRGPTRSLLRIQLTEGRNREIRRRLARLHHKVRKLKRVAIGPITDRGLSIGRFRPLQPAELSKLRRTIRTPDPKGKPAARHRKKT